MRVYRRSEFQRHIVVPLMLTCFLSGCYKWSVQPAPPTLDEAPERARITLSDGRVFELRSLEIRGDNVVGFAKSGPREDTLQTYPLADVTMFEVPKTGTAQTVGLAVAAAAAVGLLIVAASDCCVN